MNKARDDINDRDDFIELISDTRGRPTRVCSGPTASVVAWEGLDGEGVLYARSATSWNSVEAQLERDQLVVGAPPAAIIATVGSGASPLEQRADLQVLLELCADDGVRWLALTDLDRFARRADVVDEVLGQLHELQVSVALASCERLAAQIATSEREAMSRRIKAGLAGRP